MLIINKLVKTLHRWDKTTTNSILNKEYTILYIGDIRDDEEQGKENTNVAPQLVL